MIDWALSVGYMISKAAGRTNNISIAIVIEDNRGLIVKRQAGSNNQNLRDGNYCRSDNEELKWQ
jgi:hypothetical protein